MTLPFDFPTLLPSRKSRSSDAIHDWRFIDGFVNAIRTGQIATFSRASAATAVGAAGEIRSCAIGQKRWEMVDLDGDGIRETMGLLLEGAATQYLTDPAAPETQEQTLPAGTYTAWCLGTGTVTLTGGASGVASAGEPVTFTLGAEDDVTFTVAGSVTHFQCENSAAPSSFIAGASRAADVLTYTHMALPQELTRYTRFVDRGIRAAGSANHGLWSLGNAGSGAMSVALFGAATGYTLRHVGGSTRSVTTATEDTHGLEVECRAVVHANGSISLGVTVDRGAEVLEVNDTANALASEYSAAENHVGHWSTNKHGNVVLLEDRIVPGVATLGELRSPY
jgi:hypothetical protein